MGVDGFLRVVKDALVDSHLREFSGQTVVVDALSWLHKACYGCAYELATNKPTTSYVQYMLRKVALLRACGIQNVVLVFDGQRLPLKASTHAKRQGSKDENRRIGMQLLRDAQRLHGDARKAQVAKAYQHFQRTVSITQTIVANVQAALRADNVAFVVAPFEADAQMVWLCKNGSASAIVTEDSDVFLYCVTANVAAPVLFKLDDTGAVQMLSRPQLHAHCLTSTNPFLQKLARVTTGEKTATRMFVQFCVLAGCDFVDSLPNIGIVTALKHVVHFRGAPNHLRLQRIVSNVTSTTGTGATVTAPPGFLERAFQAESMFYHHMVFNPTLNRCELLLDARDANCERDIFARVLASFGLCDRRTAEALEVLEAVGLYDVLQAQVGIENGDQASYLGRVLSPDVACGVYSGTICPRTLVAPLSDTDDDHKTAAPTQTDSNSTSSSAASLLAFGFDNTDVGVAIDSDEPEQVERPKRPRIVRAASSSAPPLLSPRAIERQRVGHAKTRATSLNHLISVYAQAEAPKHARALQSSTMPSSQRLQTSVKAQSTSSTWLLERVSTAPSSTNSTSNTIRITPQKRPLEINDDDDVINSNSSSSGSKLHATAFHELMRKNRAVDATNGSTASSLLPARRAPLPTTGTTNTPTQSLSSTRTIARRATSSATKTQRKTTPSNGNGSTLLQFFQKR